MQNNDALMRILGLAMRAGKVEVGEAKAADRIKYGKTKLLIISSDASDNTLRKFEKLCGNNSVEVIKTGTREILGRYTGRDEAVVLSVSDKGFADRMKEIENI